MARVLLTVIATVDPAHESEFNRWYDEEHAPQMLAIEGCLSAARYRSLDAGDAERYVAVYEFVDEERYRAFEESADRPRLIAEYDADQGAVSTRRAVGYVRVWSGDGAAP
jgi:antibiotic biosynthesis monooxygenase (ABM) superfamily enzyme